MNDSSQKNICPSFEGKCADQKTDSLCLNLEKTDQNTSFSEDTYNSLSMWTSILLLTVLLAVIGKVLDNVLEPLVMSVFLCYLIYPVVQHLRKQGMHVGAAYSTVLTSYALIAWGLVSLISMNIQEFMDHMREYERNLTHYQEIIESLAVSFNISTNENPWTIEAMIQAIPNQTLANVMQGSAVGVFGFVGNLIIVIFFMLFILLEAEWFSTRMELVFGKEKGKRTMKTIQKINSEVERYITLKVLISAVTAILAAFTMFFFGLDFFALLAVLIFLFNFIPYFGSIVATILPGMVGLLQFENQTNTFWMVLIITIIQQFAGNYWEPRLQGRRLDLSPLLILVALGVWGWLWGVVGVILAIPIMVVLRIVFDAYPETRIFATLMGDASVIRNPNKS